MGVSKGDTRSLDDGSHIDQAECKVGNAEAGIPKAGPYRPHTAPLPSYEVYN